MIQFFVQSMRLLGAIRFGFKHDQTFRLVFFLLLNLMFLGTMFYWRVEGWSLVDALYFSVMTMSTIGYGDLVPSSDFSKLFTVLFTLTGVAAFAACGGKLVEIVLKRKEIRQEKRSLGERPEDLEERK